MKKIIMSSAVMGLSFVWAAVFAQIQGVDKPQGPSVEKMAICTGVEAMEPVGEGKEFDSSVGRLYCWTKIAAKNLPYSVKHVWYLDGKKTGEVSLAVKSNPFRTWSSKSVVPGNWKVEVLCGETGKILAAADFSVKKSM